MSAIKNVVLVGASGNVGTPALEKLVASGKFKVTILKRAGSSTTYPSGAEVVEADFSSLESLTAAFQGQDAVVSVVGDAGVIGQKLMVDAAIAAGVKRFLPSDFGSNMANPKSRVLPVFAMKVQVEDYLVEKSKTTDLTYTFVYTGAFLDFGISYNFLLDTSKSQPALMDGGDYVWSATSLPTVGDAIVGVLTHPAETKNRPVYVSEILISQKQLLSLAMGIAPERPWQPVTVKLDDIVPGAIERFTNGSHDLPTAAPMLFRSIMDPAYEGKFEKNDNELLGIKQKSEKDLIALLTPLLK